MTSRRVLLALVTLILVLAPSLHATAQETSVAEVYDVAGPHEVVVTEVADAEGATAVLFRPEDLGDGPFPALVWGNGSGSSPDLYAGLLEHLASWGFVVIATTWEEVGTGEEMRATLDHLEVMAADPADPLFRKVALDAVGVTGTSQGAGGATRSAQLDGRFRALVPINLPAEIYVSPGDEYVVEELTVPTLFFGGTLDPISPNPVNQDFYDRVPGAAGIAMLTTGGHLDVEDDGGPYRPYLTAWFRYLLAGDSFAARAFLGDAPELASDPAFNSQAFKQLPPVQAAGSPAPAVPPTTPAASPTTAPTSRPAAPAPVSPVSPGSPSRPAVPATPGRAPSAPSAPVDGVGDEQAIVLPEATPSFAAPLDGTGGQIDPPAVVVAVLVLGGAVVALTSRGSLRWRAR